MNRLTRWSMALAILLLALSPLPAAAQSSEPPPTPSPSSEPTPTIAPSSEPGYSPTVYIVQRGDTLSTIARRFGVTMAAILRLNPQIINPNYIYVGQRIVIPGPGQPPPPPGGTFSQVSIFLIALDSGGGVGCGDSTMAVTRGIQPTSAPLTAALNQLLSLRDPYYGQSGLYNALYQSNLRVSQINRRGTDWTIKLAGSLVLGGVCDGPRVQAQLEQTAKQFSTVRTVTFYINGQPLSSLISGR